MLGAAQPDALGAESRALAASSPVSALARTPSLPLRIWSAQPRIVSNSAGGSAASSSIAPSTTSPVVPSREMMSPSFTTTSPAVNCLPSILTDVGADDGGRAPAAGDDGGVADEAAAGGEDALGDHHAVHVLGAGLVAHEDDLLAALGGVGGVVGREVHLADRGARRRRQALGDAPCPSPANCGCSTWSRWSAVMRMSASCLLIFHRALPLPVPLVMSTAMLQRGGAGALADPGLQHPELALLDGELGVAHVACSGARGDRRCRAARRGSSGSGRFRCVEVFGVADAGDHIFALRVDEEVAVRLVLAGGRVAGEADAGAAELSSRLPNTIACTLTAVPRSWLIRSRTR